MARADANWLVANNFGGHVPGAMRVDNPVAATQEQSVRDLEIDPGGFTPADQMRPWARTTEEQIALDPVQMLGTTTQ